MKSKRAAPDFRICPACGTRNKAKWEYCVRCSESLADVPLGEPVETAGEGEAQAQAAESGTRGWVGGVTAGLAVLAVAALVYLVLGPAPTPAPSPSSQVFTMPTLPPKPASAPPRPQAAELYAKGMAAASRKDFSNATTLIGQALDLEDRGEWHTSLGRVYWDAGEKDQALAQLARGAESAGTGTAWMEYAHRLEQSSRSADAHQAALQAFAKEPTNVDALRFLVAFEMREGRYGEAAAHLQQQHDLQPDDPVTGQSLGQALEKSGDLRGAEQAYRAVVVRMPEADVTRGLLAEVMLKQGRGDDALGVFREGVQGRPQSPLLHRGLASMLERTGHVAEAVAEYREYARLAPNAPDARELAARADRLEKQTPTS